MKNGHGLSQTFMHALMNDLDPGINRFLEAVKKDATLCLEIRENYINIYYRGGSLVRINEKNGKFTAFFDRKYILTKDKTRVPESLSSQDPLNFEDVTTWIEAIPFLKQEMDWWFHLYPKTEREFQQLMVRENNFGGTAKSTDYFICDIEYANENGRFDLIAAHWRSSSIHRKDNKNVGLAFIEMKYMNKSMAHSAGICAHVRDMADYYRRNQDHFAKLKQEMKTVFNQKLELGLIDNQKTIESFNENIPDFILVFANHDPDSSILVHELNEIEAIPGTLPFKLKFAVSNFMGYGLYEQNIFGLKEFKEIFSEQIFAKRKNMVDLKE